MINFSDDLTIVKNYTQFVELFNTITLDDIVLISLDHDLGETVKEKTGYDVAKWLVELSIFTKKDLPLIQCHSANPVGADNIINFINSYLRHQHKPQTCRKALVELKRGIKL